MSGEIFEYFLYTQSSDSPVVTPALPGFSSGRRGIRRARAEDDTSQSVQKHIEIGRSSYALLSNQATITKS
jgi:hypothetical protein